MTAMAHLVAALRDPASVAQLDADQWSALISVARTEVLLGTLAHRLADQPLPAPVADMMAAARTAMSHAQLQALWEAKVARRILDAAGVPFVLLKGTAYAVAGLSNAAGRQIGDLDILVARANLDRAEMELIAAGWEWVKDDPYDQSYYRTYMHELPPLIHRDRDRMVDVHHTILPLTARPTPNPSAMVEDAMVTVDGWRILSPDDIIIHCAAHLIADGELDGGLRNLWDLHCLLGRVESAERWHLLRDRAQLHQLWPALSRGARLAQRLYGTVLPGEWAGRSAISDAWFIRRLLARDDWGRESHRSTRLAFTVRGHLLRMPPLMLARHLWIKWHKR